MCELHEKSNRKLIVDECVNTANECTAVVKLGGEMSCSEWCEDAAKYAKRLGTTRKAANALRKKKKIWDATPRACIRWFASVVGSQNDRQGAHI